MLPASWSQTSKKARLEWLCCDSGGWLAGDMLGDGKTVDQGKMNVETKIISVPSFSFQNICTS